MPVQMTNQERTVIDGQRTARPVLLIEDDTSIALSLQVALTNECLDTIVASDGEAGITRFRAEHPALVLLDLALPKVSGMDVCRLVRAESSLPIIIVSARDSEADRVAALEAGADDYVTKPFSVKELVARIRAQLRRMTMLAQLGETMVLRSGPVELDAGRHEVFVRGEHVPFTPKEFKLLEILLRGDARLRTRDFLIDRVWGQKYFGDTKTLDVHVKRIRAKIERDPHRPEHLVTVRGIGYRFLSEPGHPDPR